MRHHPPAPSHSPMGLPPTGPRNPQRQGKGRFFAAATAILISGAALAGWPMAEAAAEKDGREAPRIASIMGASEAGGSDVIRGMRFSLCEGSGRTNCVVDGDTFRLAGERIRIADIDTPETHRPQCPAEAALGEAATRRLHALLNAGTFTLQSIDRDTDRFGRKLRIVTRGGESIGGQLVREGLARPYRGGPRAGWC
jgi:micrococcal nuclease